MTIAATSFEANGRRYHPPARPIVVVCIDGSADEYLDATLARRRMPNLERMAQKGYRGLVRAALPTFTNVNNAAIITGCPPQTTGISGNFFLNPETGEEVMMNSSKYLRCGTILSAAAKAGRKVGMVTAKDKLREILSHELQGIAFSAEKAASVQADVHGISNVEALVGRPAPAIYSGDASLYTLDAGVALLKEGLADFLYLSLTDYMQHRYSPEDEESLQFYQEMDNRFGELLELGAVLGLTADHGMNAKTHANGDPHVLYVESILAEKFGPGATVICPITDPYVVHHGALGSFVTVHLPPFIPVAQAAQFLLGLDGITEVYDRETAARKLQLPADRIGDLCVLSGRDVVVGRTPEHHDLSQLAEKLRSHGGRYEEMVPMILSEPLSPRYYALASADSRNFDIFDFTCNGTRE
ncbi:phosphonoacetate hydrolase [Planctomicrobium sp. SH527]|uniref:phosphonoacetate hydrolase n=1 Tax=Planctomicrobium sp. SH527 TaxID=3448123 RepID=UPI003F5C41B3